MQKFRVGAKVYVIVGKKVMTAIIAECTCKAAMFGAAQYRYKLDVPGVDRLQRNEDRIYTSEQEAMAKCI